MNARALQQHSEFAAAVLEGLAKPQKALSPRYFYDREGSELFDRLCDCPEYYVTRTEMAILEERAPHIAKLAGERAAILEFGSGASRKTRILLDAIPRAGAYVPIDISHDMLMESARKLGTSYPRLKILPICADFTAPVTIPWESLPADCGRSLIFFPGSTLGNFEPAEACALLKRVADLAGPGGLLLLGVDRVKSAEVLNAAYNDSQGITAAFNLNLLRRMQTELGARIDLSGFAHEAFFNPDRSRIEMHLVSRREQVVRILGYEFHFDAGESVHTENSYKYTPEGLSELASRAGLQSRALWSDPQQLFAVALFEIV